MRSIIVIAHDIRSTHNVGSLLRTCEGLGIEKVYMTGYTPYPSSDNEERLPYIAAKLTKQIEKTALGATYTQPWQHHNNVSTLISSLKDSGYTLAALEQSETSIKLPAYKPPEKLVILLGREVEGITEDLLKSCDVHLEIPMFGQKESFNVVQAAAMALFHCRFA